MDDDDDEFVPRHLRKAMRGPGERGGGAAGETGDSNRRRLAELLGEDVLGDGELDASFAHLAGDSGGSSLFVSGGGLQDQLSKGARPATDEAASASALKRRRTSAPAAPVIPEATRQAEAKVKSSIGATLLAKLGYSGKGGLGKDGKGITQALDVKVRPANAGLGMVQEKTEAQRLLEHQRRQQALGGAAAEEAEQQEEESQQQAATPVKWSKLNLPGSQSKRARRASRVAPVMKSADQVLQEDNQTTSAAGGVTIIDLTGPQERLLNRTNSMSNLASPAGPELGRELRYNLSKLVDAAEVDLKQHNRRLAMVKQKQTTFGQQAEMLGRAQAENDAALGVLREATALLERLEASQPDMSRSTRDSDEAAVQLTMRLCSAFTGARQRFGEALYRAAGFADLLFELLQGPLRAYYGRHRGTLGVDMGVARALKAVWQDEPTTDYWNAWVFQVVVPEFQRFITRDWEVEGDTQALACAAVRQWDGVWSSSARHYVIHEVVWPRLKAAVDAWNPYTAQVALHEWVHPWHELFEGRLERDLYPGIVYKLTQALTDWNPTDGSAYELLRPWGTGKLTPSQLEGLAQGRILPKLHTLASTVDLNDTAALDALLLWHDWIARDAFVKLLARTLFPRLSRTVYEWMRSIRDGPFEVVVAWYRSWKAALPEALASDPRIRLLLAHLLDVALNVFLQPEVDFEPELLPRDLFAPAAKAVPSAGASGAAVATGPAEAGSAGHFRALVEAFAGKHNVVFVPLLHRTHNGKPLYSFGSIPVLLSDNVVHCAAQPGGAWKPISLDHLADLAKASGSSGNAAADVD